MPLIERAPNGTSGPRNLAGQIYGKLTIISQEPGRCPNGYALWKAQCKCGQFIVRPSYRFRNKYTAMQCCPECAPVGRPRVPDNGAHVNALFTGRKRSAKERKLAWEITKEHARSMFESNCFYCDGPPQMAYTHKNLSGSYAWNGIDRVDNSLGYIPSNCVSCCWDCNRAKGTLSHEDFMEWIKRLIVKHSD